MSNGGGAERRARKAERRAENIRKHARPNDRGAERRAQKAERRAQNIRDHADRGSTHASSKSSDSESNATWVAGCVVVVLLFAAVAKVIDVVRGWFDWLF